MKLSSTAFGILRTLGSVYCVHVACPWLLTTNLQKIFMRIFGLKLVKLWRYKRHGNNSY